VDYNKTKKDRLRFTMHQAGTIQKRNACVAMRQANTLQGIERRFSTKDRTGITSYEDVMVHTMRALQIV